MVENKDQVLHFNEYFRVIRNRLWVIFTIFILTVLSGAYVTEEVLPKIYTASTQIQMFPEGTTTIRPTGGEGAPKQNFDAIDFKSDLEIMQSTRVLMPIITELELDKVWAKRIYKGAVEKLSPSEAMAHMTGGLQFDVKVGTNIIVISASSDDAKEAAAIANAVADHYKTMREVEQDERISRGADSLRGQIAEQQAIVDKAKDTVDKMFQAAGGKGIEMTTGGTSAQDRLETDLATNKTALLNSKEEYDARRVLLEKTKDLSDEEFLNTLSALNKSDPNISALRSDNFKTQSDIANLLKDGFEENHPKILSMQAEIASNQNQIKGLIVGLRRAMEVDVDMAQSRVALLQKEVDDLTVKIRLEATSDLEPYHQAQREEEQQQSILDAYNVHLKQLIADKQLFESPITIISRAEPPDAPKSKKSLYMSWAIAAGLIVGVAVAFLIEYLDTSVKTMADAESLLGLPVLTVIPNKGGPMPLTTEAARLPHAEGYRILRAKLDLKVQNGVGPSLTMLSGGPGEGKSTTIYNLAIVCAQAGQTVILVDCDLRRPTVHTLVNIPNDRGLANYLRGEGEAVEYIQQSAVPKLHVLAAGDMPMSEIGVLAGDKIRAMLEDLKQRYDLVLVDSPPVLGISDGSIIAREVDYVILVIQHRRYPREISLRAKRAIEEVHGNCVGMVLNCVSVKSDDSYYYYSNYGNYYKKVDRTKKRKSEAKAVANGHHENGKNGKAASSRKKELDSEEF